MNRRLPLIVACIAAMFAAIGLVGLDYPLARWVRSSGLENAPIFRHGIALADVSVGMHLWYWLAGTLCLAVGLAGLLLIRRMPRRLAWALACGGTVQIATLHTMIFMKNAFGRLRPHQVLDSGNWDVIWNAGGGSFPSGHSAFYFGLLLPMAAFARDRGLRLLLIAIPVFIVLGRINLAKHYLSDVSVSALIAALYTLLAAYLVQALQERRAG